MSVPQCNLDISQIRLNPPQVSCQNYKNVEAWKKFVEDFRSFTTSKDFLQILIQCTCLNGAQCMVKKQCPILKDDALAVYTNPTCRDCIFAGDPLCAKFNDDMKKVAGVIIAFQNLKSNTLSGNLSREDSLNFLVNTVNYYCDTKITVADVDPVTVDDIVYQLLLITGLNNNNNNNTSPPNNTNNNSSGVSKTLIWIILSACLFVILILVGIFYWYKSRKGGLSRQMKKDIITRASRGMNVTDQLATLGGENLAP